MRWPPWLHAPDAGLRGPGRPDAVRRSGTGTPILALHGFGGTPREVDLVIEVASDLGRPALAPLLPGHGGPVRDLAATRFADWARAGAAALHELAGDGGKVALVGLSMGAVVAAHLAVAHPRAVASVTLLGNALWLRRRVALAADLWASCGGPDLYVPKRASDLCDATARATHLSSGAMPIRAVVSLVAAGRQTRARLGSITAPVFIAHGARDRVCPPANAWRAAALLTATTPRVVLLPQSAHIVTRDVERAALAAELRGFLAGAS